MCAEKISHRVPVLKNLWRDRDGEFFRNRKGILELLFGRRGRLAIE